MALDAEGIFERFGSNNEAIKDIDHLGSLAYILGISREEAMTVWSRHRQITSEMTLRHSKSDLADASFMSGIMIGVAAAQIFAESLDEVDTN